METTILAPPPENACLRRAGPTTVRVDGRAAYHDEEGTSSADASRSAVDGPERRDVARRPRPGGAPSRARRLHPRRTPARPRAVRRPGPRRLSVYGFVLRRGQARLRPELHLRHVELLRLRERAPREGPRVRVQRGVRRVAARREDVRDGLAALPRRGRPRL